MADEPITNGGFGASFYGQGTILKGPKGDPGKDGAQGIPGPEGPPGPGPTTSQLNEAASVALAANPPPKGDTGPVGPAGTITVRYVTKGDAASVVNVGTPEAALLDFVLPKGDQGPPGEKGEQGLKGDQGQQGLKGDTGSKGDKGDTGPKGDTGAQGPAGQNGSTDAQTLQGKAASAFLEKTGGTLTGNLTISAPASMLVLDRTTTTGNDSAIDYKKAGVTRWNIGYSVALGRLYMNRFDASGNYQNTFFQVEESDGVLRSNGNPVMHTGNDGAGSGFDADTVDGLHADAFLRRSTNTWIADDQGQARFYFQGAGGGGRTYASYATAFVFRRDGSDADLAYVDSTGGLTCASVNSFGNITAFSDKRLKSNIRPLKDAPEIVSKLSGYRYDMNGAPSVGVMAQEVLEVLPELVTVADDDRKTLSVAYGNLTAVLIEAVKDLQAQVASLKEQIA